jgi:branched-chain amino acid transport system permease protein
VATVIQLIISGIAIGSVYGLVALGFVTIYRTCGVVNFAQGEFVMLGGMLSYWLWKHAHLPYAAAAVLTIVAVCVFGLGIYQLVVAPLRRAPAVMIVLGTLAVSALIEAIALLWFEGWPIYGPSFSSTEILDIAGVGVYTQNLWVIGMVAVVVTALALLNNKTHLGKKMTATATDPLAAGLVGVRSGSMIRLAFIISAAIGAIGGIFISPVIPMTYSVGAGLALKGFVAAVLGGWGTASGAVAGGVVLGVIEMLVGGYLPSGFQDAIAFILLILVLAVRPRGLLGKPLIVEEG